jgi:uncharacterized protein YndB with AHSA1/START domain
MERKTKVEAEENKQYVLITRDFDLPVELLFRAHVEAELIEQWMGTKVLKFEPQNHGGYQFETSDGQGKILVKMNGVIHEIVPNKKIIRTFQMENASFDVQLEFLEFEKLTDDTSRLTIQSIFKSVELRNAQLKLPFAYGINMAHNRLQNIIAQLK